MAFNFQQQEIIDMPAEAPGLVLAGAGSGKTFVIAHRTIRLAALLPDGLCLQLLTFSNKAAKEMKERVRRIGNVDLSKVRFDTFHSFGMRLIRDDPAGYGLGVDFSLLNESDVKRSIGRLAKENGLPAKKDLEPADRKRLDPMAWLNTWSLARQDGFDVTNSANQQALLERLTKTHDLSLSESYIAWKTLTGFEKEKASSNALDFDDLLFLPLRRMHRDSAYQSLVRSTIGSLMTDESQDTNRVQLELIKKIALGHCGVLMVGDDDQSIYSWRGARITNIKRFLHAFGAKEFRLERNYRSTKAIVNSSLDLIRNNTERMEKTPFSEGDEGVPITLDCFEDHRDMADAVARNIAKSIEAGTPPSEIAILYRTNRMAMLLEQSLRRSGIHYTVVGGRSLFDRSEVTAVTSALRVARNPKDVFAIKTLIDYVDGFGEGSAYSLCEWIEELPTNSLENLPDSIPRVSEAKLAVFKRFFAELQDEVLLAREPKEFIQWVVDGPMRVLDREKDEDLRDRKGHHLDALGRDIQEELVERKAIDPRLSWRDVMVEVALRDVRQTEAEHGVVTLSTIHRSKGLEWDHVHIPGFSEGLMPLDSRSEVNQDEAGYSHIEEERRLGFVGITRAKSVCKTYHSTHYGFAGGNEDRVYEPSRFLDEMNIQAPKVLAAIDFDDANDDFDVSAFSSAFAKFSPRSM
jgi:superfamily I DNA/RNA helicase